MSQVGFSSGEGGAAKRKNFFFLISFFIPPSPFFPSSECAVNYNIFLRGNPTSGTLKAFLLLWSFLVEISLGLHKIQKKQRRLGRIIFLRIMIACGYTLRASLLLSWYFPFFLSYNLWCGNGSKVHMGDLADPDPWGKNCRKFTSKIAENLKYFFLNEQNLLTLSSTISIERWVAIQILEYKNRPASKLRLDPQHYCQYRYI